MRTKTPSATASERERSARAQIDAQRQHRLQAQLQEIVQFFGTCERQRTLEVIQLGQMAHEYIMSAIGAETAQRARFQIRQWAIESIREEIQRLYGGKHDVNRFIAVFQLTRIIEQRIPGAMASSIPIGVLKYLQPLIERDRDTEQWFLSRERAETAETLLRDVLASKPTIAEVRDRVGAIIGKPRPPRRHLRVHGPASRSDSSPGHTAAEIVHLAEQSDSAANAWRMLGNILEASAVQALIAGIVESAKSDALRSSVWATLLSAIEMERSCSGESLQVQPAGKGLTEALFDNVRSL